MHLSFFWASGPPIVTRRRRRRSITNASPARSPSQSKNSITAHDADGEDNDGADREDSPEHIYHQIGTDELVRVSKLPKSSSQSPGKCTPSESDKVIITKNSASRRPRVNISQGNRLKSYADFFFFLMNSFLANL